MNSNPDNITADQLRASPRGYKVRSPWDDHGAMGVRCEPRNHAHDDDGRLGQYLGTSARYWKPFDQRLRSSGDSMGKLAILCIYP